MLRFRPTLTAALAVVLAVAPVVAACSGDGVESGSSAATPPSTTTTPAGATATTKATADSSVAIVSEECEGLLALALGVIRVFSGEVEGADELFATAEDALPGDLTGHIAILESAALEFAAGIDAMGENPFLDQDAFAEMTPEQLEQLDQVIAIFDDPAIDAAFEAVDDYGDRECGGFGLNQ